jgi:hypothetical protein
MTINECAAEQLKRQMMNAMKDIRDAREEFAASGQPETPQCVAHGKMTVGVSWAMELLLLSAIVEIERKQQAVRDEALSAELDKREAQRTWRDALIAMIPVIFGSGIVSTAIFVLLEKVWK